MRTMICLFDVVPQQTSLSERSPTRYQLATITYENVFWGKARSAATKQPMGDREVWPIARAALRSAGRQCWLSLRTLPGFSLAVRAAFRRSFRPSLVLIQSQASRRLRVVLPIRGHCPVNGHPSGNNIVIRSHSYTNEGNGGNPSQGNPECGPPQSCPL
jgi:hypothetical protein